jgi:sorbitol-specific phosphotransferase system component IIC
MVMVIIVLVMVVIVAMKNLVVTVVRDVASRINCFARRLHESAYFKYLLMTSISSSPAAATEASF